MGDQDEERDVGSWTQTGAGWDGDIRIRRGMRTQEAGSGQGHGEKDKNGDTGSRAVDRDTRSRKEIRASGAGWGAETLEAG